MRGLLLLVLLALRMPATALARSAAGALGGLLGGAASSALLTLTCLAQVRALDFTDPMWTQLDSSGKTAHARLTFELDVTIPNGGDIVLLLPPDGWAMAANPVVTFLDPGGLSAFGTWTSSLSQLEVSVGSGSVSAGQPVVLQVSDVTAAPFFAGTRPGAARCCDVVPCDLDVSADMRTVGGYCGGSAMPTCQGNKTYSQLEAFCESRNGFVCGSQSQLLATNNSGCGYDDEWVWTSESCLSISGESVAALQRPGSSVGNTRCTPTQRLGTIRAKNSGGTVIGGDEYLYVNVSTGTAANASWTPVHPSPGVVTDAFLRFTPSTDLPAGGELLLVLPDDGWAMPAAPAVAFQEPSAVAATAAWTASLRQLVVTTAGAPLPAGTRANLTVVGTTTPETVHTYSFATLSSRLANGGVLDGPNNVTALDVLGAQVPGSVRFEGYVGTTDEAALNLTLRGAVAIGGRIDVVLPVGGWSMPASPAVTFYEPPGVTGTVAWSAGSRRMEITTATAPIGERADVFLRVASVTAPEPGLRSGLATVASRAPSGGVIDGPSQVAALTDVCEIDVWRPLNFSRVAGVPGTMELALGLETGLGVGDTLELYLPVGEWDFASATPEVSAASFTVTSAWTSSLRRLVVTTTGAPLAAGNVTVAVSGLYTAAAAAEAGVATLRTRASGSGTVLCVATNVTVEPVSAGEFLGDRLWLPVTPSFGSDGAVNLTFFSQGSVPATGSIRVVLPSTGWEIPAAPVVTLAAPNDAVALTASWTASTRVLDLALGGGGAALPAETSVVLQVADVTAPYAAATGVVTVASRLANGKLISGPTQFTAPMLTTGALWGDLAWQPAFSTVNVYSSANLTFRTQGVLPTGSVVRVVLPDQGWQMDLTPVVVVAAPSDAGAVPISSWTPATRVLDITLALAGIPAHENIILVVSSVTTPDREYAQTTASVTTRISSGFFVDGPTLFSFAATVPGSIAGPLTLTPSANSPGRSASLLLEFDITGRLPLQSRVRAVFPREALWAMHAAPQVEVVQPGQASATAHWFSGNQTLTVTLAGAVVGPDQAVQLRVFGVTTPAQVTETSHVVEVTTYNQGNYRVDGPSNLTVPAFPAAQLGGALNFSLSPPAPAAVSQLVLAFNVTGRVPAGGRVVAVFPDVGFGGNRTVSVLMTEPVPEKSLVELVLADVTTPASTVTAFKVSLRTEHPLGGIIDRATNISGSVPPGHISGFRNASASPSTAGQHGVRLRVQFAVTGSVAVGGHVVLVLPNDGWAMSAMPSVSGGTAAAAAAAAVAAWNAGSRELTVTNMSLAQGAAAELVVHSVTTPDSVRAAGVLTLRTLSAAGGLVNGPASVTVAAVPAGTLAGGVLQLAAHVTEARTYAHVNTSTTGAVAAGGRFVLVLPDDGWSLPASPPVTSSTATVASASWASGSRRVSWVVGGGGIAGNASVHFTIGGLTAPAVGRLPAVATLTSEVADGTLIDGPASFTIERIDAAPVLSSVPTAALDFYENDAAAAVASGVVLTDQDGSLQSQALVSINRNYHSDQDVLSLPAAVGGVTGSWDGALGVLALNGTAADSVFQAALRTVTYNCTSQDPSTDVRQLRFWAVDATGAESTAVARNVSVHAVNDAPSVEASEGPPQLRWAEHDPPVNVSALMRLRDVDSRSFESLSVVISEGLLPDEDLLTCANGTYNATSGVLLVNGTASVAAFQRALRSVEFSSSSEDPGVSRTFEFSVNDGALDSVVVSRSMLVVPRNDPPVLAPFDADAVVVYEENAAPVNVTALGEVVISDLDLSDPFLFNATVRIAGAEVGRDVLSVPSTGQESRLGELVLRGVQATHAYQSLLRTVQFSSSTEDPAFGNRSVHFQVCDVLACSNVEWRNVTLLPANDAPVLGAVGVAGEVAVYVENAVPVNVSTTVNVSDVDVLRGPMLANASVAIVRNLDAATDRLVFRGVSGVNVSGEYDAATGVLDLWGHALPRDYQTALRSVGFESKSEDPDERPRLVELRVWDDHDEPSQPLFRNVSVEKRNDLPVIANLPAWPANFTENGAAVNLSTALNSSDADVSDQVWSNASVRITGNYQSSGDVLTLLRPSNFSVSWKVGTGLLFVSGDAPRTEYQSALRTVTYHSTSEAPRASQRTVSFWVHDQWDPSHVAATRTVDVTEVNDAPSLLGLTATPIASSGSSPALVAPEVTFYDVDDNNFAYTRLSLSPYSVGDQLRTSGGVLDSFFDVATGVLTVNQTGSFSQHQTAMRSVEFYRSEPLRNGTEVKLVTLEVNDGDDSSDWWGANNTLIVYDGMAWTALPGTASRPGSAVLEADLGRSVTGAGELRLAFADARWSMPRYPSSSVGGAAWDADAAVLTLNYTSGLNQTLRVVLQGVTTPLEITDETAATLELRDAAGTLVGGPAAVAVGAVGAGAVLGAELVPEPPVPCAEGSVTLTMAVQGALTPGATLRAFLPAEDGWTTSVSAPMARQRTAPGVWEPVNATWDAAVSVYHVDVAPVAAGGELRVELWNVTMPPQFLFNATQANVTTFSATGRLVDGPSRLNISRIVPFRHNYTHWCPGFASGDACLAPNSSFRCAFGQGEGCYECPTGGLCPGGHRMWPQPGYWTPYESFGDVSQCRHPSTRRCAGWTDHDTFKLRLACGAAYPYAACGSGYDGLECGSCAPGYYQRLRGCEKCGSEQSLAIPIFLFIVVLVFFVALPPRVLQHLLWCALLLQPAATIVAYLAEDVNPTLEAVALGLQLSHLRLGVLAPPECSSSSSSSMGEDAFVLVVALLLVALAALPGPRPPRDRAEVEREERERQRQLQLESGSTMREGPSRSPVFNAGELLFEARKCLAVNRRLLLGLLLLVYCEVLRRCLRLLACEPLELMGAGEGTSLRMLADTEVECFSGSHLGLFVLVVVVALAFLLPAVVVSLRFIGRVASRRRLALRRAGDPVIVGSLKESGLQPEVMAEVLSSPSSSPSSSSAKAALRRALALAAKKTKKKPKVVIVEAKEEEEEEEEEEGQEEEGKDVPVVYSSESESESDHEADADEPTATADRVGAPLDAACFAALFGPDYRPAWCWIVVVDWLCAVAMVGIGAVLSPRNLPDHQLTACGLQCAVASAHCAAFVLTTPNERGLHWKLLLRVVADLLAVVLSVTCYVAFAEREPDSSPLLSSLWSSDSAAEGVLVQASLLLTALFLLGAVLGAFVRPPTVSPLARVLAATLEGMHSSKQREVKKAYAGFSPAFQKYMAAEVAQEAPSPSSSPCPSPVTKSPVNGKKSAKVAVVAAEESKEADEGEKRAGPAKARFRQEQVVDPFANTSGNFSTARSTSRFAPARAEVRVDTGIAPAQVFGAQDLQTSGKDGFNPYLS